MLSTSFPSALFFTVKVDRHCFDYLPGAVRFIFYFKLFVFAIKLLLTDTTQELSENNIFRFELLLANVNVCVAGLVVLFFFPAFSCIVRKATFAYSLRFFVSGHQRIYLFFSLCICA